MLIRFPLLKVLASCGRSVGLWVFVFVCVFKRLAVWCGCLLCAFVRARACVAVVLMDSRRETPLAMMSAGGVKATDVCVFEVCVVASGE